MTSLGLGVPSLEAVANSDAYLKQETAPINHQLFLDTMSYANVKPCFRGYDEWATSATACSPSGWAKRSLSPRSRTRAPGRRSVGRGGGIGRAGLRSKD
ncbi:MAG: hypothetical protein R2854_29715 [Caldilineaceae bacterium]